MTECEAYGCTEPVAPGREGLGSGLCALHRKSFLSALIETSYEEPPCMNCNLCGELTEPTWMCGAEWVCERCYTRRQRRKKLFRYVKHPTLPFRLAWIWATEKFRKPEPVQHEQTEAEAEQVRARREVEL